jgi:diguanylate cyclase (GGDEF)-like protein
MALVWQAASVDAHTMSTARRLVWVSTWVVLVAYAGGLLLHGKGFDTLTDGWLGILTQVLPAIVCWIGVAGARTHRLQVTCLAVAISAFCIGNAVYVIAAGGSLALPYPSVADVGYLAFYPLILATIVLAVRRELRGIKAAVWLDSILGGLGGACALAVLLGPVFKNTTGGSFATVVALTYPMCDLLLVATVVGVAALQGWRLTPAWSWALAGLAVMTISDLVYSLRIANDSYLMGTILDVGWPLGLALLAGSAYSPPRTRRPQRPVLAMPVFATLIGVTVLALASRIHITTIAVVLAVLTLVGAAARTQLAFRQLRRLADLRRQATTDDLTGLPNRRALYAAVAQALDGPLRPHALLLLDLDRFKEVNDSLGHHVGDQLLIRVAERLRAQLRPHDVLARLGADEFAVLLVDAEQAHAVEVAARLRGSLTDPMTLAGIALHTGVSIGIALSPDHGSDATVLLRRADMAMYKAKTARSGHQVYAGNDDLGGAERLRTIHELRTALAENQLVLYYQPKIDLRTSDVRGVEALVRWNHPSRGVLQPDCFLELIEECGLMPALTRYVLDVALRQAAVWESQGRPLTVAVNLSAGSLLDSSLPTYIAGQLTARGVAAAHLQLEITEQTLMSDRNRARVILTALRELGVKISIDDFGTGYSSLAYLRDLPLDELKLDRLFISPMTTDTRANALVGSTIGLAHSLGLRLVAEGVEDNTTYSELRRLGCDEVQGYYLSRPIPAADLDRWIDDRRALPPPRSGVIVEAARSPQG